MSEHVSAGLRRLVVERAEHRCEYCGVPDTSTFVPHEPDHVTAHQNGDTTTADNLAYACFECNRFKGPNLSSIGPLTRIITTLYSPRTPRVLPAYSPRTPRVLSCGTTTFVGAEPLSSR